MLWRDSATKNTFRCSTRWACPYPGGHDRGLRGTGNSSTFHARGPGVRRRYRVGDQCAGGVTGPRRAPGPLDDGHGLSVRLSCRDSGHPDQQTLAGDCLRLRAGTYLSRRMDTKRLGDNVPTCKAVWGQLACLTIARYHFKRSYFDATNGRFHRLHGQRPHTTATRVAGDANCTVRDAARAFIGAGHLVRPTISLPAGGVR